MKVFLRNVKDFLRRWPLATFFVLICIASLFSSGWMIHTVTPTSDVRSYYENIAEYHFIPLTAEAEISVEQNSNAARISWKGLEEKVYITSFDGGVGSMPSETFRKLAAIPRGTREIQVDVSLRGQYNMNPKENVETILYLVAYDEDGQTAIESITPEYSNPRERPRNFTICLDVDDHSKFFKIMLRISPLYRRSEAGFVEISKLDVIFH